MEQLIFFSIFAVIIMCSLLFGNWVTKTEKAKGFGSSNPIIPFGELLPEEGMYRIVPDPFKFGVEIYEKDSVYSEHSKWYETKLVWKRIKIFDQERFDEAVAERGSANTDPRWYYQDRVFDSAAEAEAYIDEQLEARQRREQLEREKQQFIKDNPPRIYLGTN